MNIEPPKTPTVIIDDNLSSRAIDEDFAKVPVTELTEDEAAFALCLLNHRASWRAKTLPGVVDQPEFSAFDSKVREELVTVRELCLDGYLNFVHYVRQVHGLKPKNKLNRVRAIQQAEWHWLEMILAYSAIKKTDGRI